MRWNHFQDILPVLTLAIGYAGTFVTERFRDRNEERRARGSAMQNFERSVLLETQAALYQYAGEMQDFAFALRGQSDRSYSKIVGTAWRASAQLEMLTTRVSGEATRDRARRGPRGRAGDRVGLVAERGRLVGRRPRPPRQGRRRAARVRAARRPPAR